MASTLESLAFEGMLITPDNPRYDDARKVFNGMVDRRPKLIARCAGTEDVKSAIAYAREHELPLSIRGGGHNVAGNAAAMSVNSSGAAAHWSRKNAEKVIRPLREFGPPVAAGREIEIRYGLASIEGGRHPAWGTANRIVPLGDSYEPAGGGEPVRLGRLVEVEPGGTRLRGRNLASRVDADLAQIRHVASAITRVRD